MVKAATDVTPIVERYISTLKRKLGVERVILSDIETAGVDGEPTSVWFVVISSAFEGMDLNARIEELVRIGMDVSPLIQAWGYTPEDLAAHYDGHGPDLLLPQLLYGSREVYRKAGASSLETLRKAAGGKR